MWRCLLVSDDLVWSEGYGDGGENTMVRVVMPMMDKDGATKIVTICLNKCCQGAKMAWERGTTSMHYNLTKEVVYCGGCGTSSWWG